MATRFTVSGGASHAFLVRGGGGRLLDSLQPCFQRGGIVARWLPLTRRPEWLEAALSQPWSDTLLAQFLTETPYLVLEAPEAAMQALRAHLSSQNLLQETFLLPAYLRSPLTTAPVTASSPQELEAWRTTYEELQSDLDLAARWLPCILTAQIV